MAVTRNLEIVVDAGDDLKLEDLAEILIQARGLELPMDSPVRVDVQLTFKSPTKIARLVVLTK